VVCAQVEGSGCAELEWRLRGWVDGSKAWGVGAGGVVRALRGLVRRACVAALAAAAAPGPGGALHVFLLSVLKLGLADWYGFTHLRDCGPIYWRSWCRSFFVLLTPISSRLWCLAPSQSLTDVCLLVQKDMAGGTAVFSAWAVLLLLISPPSARASSATQIAAGGSHTCALLSGGTVRCWGLSSSGQLGYANTNTIGDNETPASAGDVNVGGTVTQVVAGGEHTCALLSGGTVRCWGLSSSGQLGYANTNNIGDNETPASAGNVNVGGTVAQLSAGSIHTCALLSGGTVRCWGSASNGRLGYASAQTRSATTRRPPAREM